jgi:DNA (cytosine-5)-methyltransferase 1
MSEYNKENPLRVFEAFAGYGSQHLAFNKIKEQIPGFDFKVVGISEIDKYAIQAYGAVHGECPNYGDISKINWDEVPDFDFFSYSSPCQDFSNAGLQRGGEEGSGTRSSLLWECRKAIEAKRPKYLLLENVKALVSKKFAPTFLKWLAVLEEMGYTNYFQVLNAKEHGVPQNRERVFCVSILGEHKPYHFPEPVPLTILLKDILEEEVDDKYVLSETAIQGFLKHNENHKAKGTGFLWIPKDVDSPGGADC